MASALLNVYIQLSQGKEISKEVLEGSHLSSDELNRLQAEARKKEELESSKQKMSQALTTLKIPLKDFNIEEYQKLLSITRIAYALEQNGVPEEHAAKLLHAFGSYDAAISFLKRYAAAYPPFHYHIVHDACLFSLPTEEVNTKLWQVLAQKFMPDERFEKVLALAPQIERFITENRKELEELFRAEFMRGHEQRLGDEWEKSVSGLEKYIQTNMAKQKSKIKIVINKQFSYLVLEKLLKPGKISKDKKRTDEERELLRKYEASDEGQKLRKEIEAKITQEWEQRFRDEYAKFAKLGSANAEKQKYIEEQFKKNAAEIELECQDFCLQILSENTPLESLLDYLSQVSYKNANYNPVAAALFFRNGVPESEFDRYISLKPSETSSIPEIFIEGDKIGYPGFYIKKLSSKDPKAAILGKLTSCCQWMGGAGGDCAIHGITSPDGGFYVLCQMKKGQKIPLEDDIMLAQCWAWRGESNRIVFDSIESQINFRENQKEPKNKRLLTDFFVLLAHKLVTEKEFSQVLLGKGASPEELVKYRAPKMEHPKDYSNYRDSFLQYVLTSSSPYFVKLYLQSNPDSILQKTLGDLKKPTKAQILEWVEFCAIHEKPELLKLILDEDKEKGFDEVIKGHYDLTRSYIKTLNEKDFKGLMELIEKGSSIYLKNIDGKDVLHLAAEAGSLVMVKYLIDRGFYINSLDDKGCTALYHAIAHERLDVVKFLVEKGADVRKVSYDGTTALHMAAFSGNLDMVKYLVECGAEIDKDMGGFSALTSAVIGANFDVVKYLIEEGASVNKLLNDGKNILQIAVSSRKLNIVQYLIEKGADVKNVDYEGKNALHKQISRVSQPLEMVKLLVKNGLDVNLADNEGRTPLHYAIKDNNLLLVKSLLQNGADVNKATASGDTPLGMVCMNEIPSLDMIKILVENGADIDKSNDALYWAVVKGILVIVKFLVENGAKLSDSILQIAIQHSRFDMLDYLIKDRRMDVNSITFNIVSSRIDEENIKYLVDKGWDINKTSAALWTLLHYSAFMGDLNMVKFLVEKGIDVNIKNNEGKTALDLVPVTESTKEVIQYLTEKANEQKEKVKLTAFQISKETKSEDTPIERKREPPTI